MDDEYGDTYFWTPWGTGAAHSVSGDTDDESVIDRLHRVVEEVTGKPVEKPPARKIGFY